MKNPRGVGLIYSVVLLLRSRLIGVGDDLYCPITKTDNHQLHPDSIFV
ncbi:protein of unknown function [Xenorhabdus nematophila AN6/1]|nr:protein of unknown function [Xenorhabdus nematophila AN6/1]